MREVDAAAWARLRQELRDAYAELRAAVGETIGSGTPEAVGGAVGAIAHAVYHLGAVRQKVAVIRKA